MKLSSEDLEEMKSDMQVISDKVDYRSSEGKKELESLCSLIGGKVNTNDAQLLEA